MKHPDQKYQNLIRESTLDLLTELRDKTRMTAAIAVISEDERNGVVLASLPGLSDHCFLPRPGSRFALNSTAPGKALLAYLPPPDQRRILRQLDLRRSTATTLTDVDLLLRHLQEQRKQGFFPDAGENLEVVNCVASTIFDEAGQPIAAVWITGLVLELPLEEISHYSGQVIATAKEMELRLRNARTSISDQSRCAIERAKQFIEQNYPDDRAVRELHRQIGMSDSWFRKLFRERYGIAPMSYRLQLLHERACELLLDTHLSVKEIAFQLGYDSQNYFSRAFKKAQGLSPAHFRAQSRSWEPAQFPWEENEYDPEESSLNVMVG